MKAAILRFDPYALRALLQLPESVTISRAEVDHRYHGCLDVVIHGAGWETIEGGAIMCAPPAEITVENGKAVSIDWKLPQ